MNAVANIVPTSAKNILNEIFKGREPWEIVGMTSTSILATIWFYNFIYQEESIKKRLIKSIMKLAKHIPAVREKIQNEMKSLNDTFEKETLKRTKGVPYILNLPEEGMDTDKLLKLIELHVNLGGYNWKNGRVSGCVYRVSDENLKRLVKEAYGYTALTNPLHPDVFPGICKMEAELVRITCKLFNGDDETCGSMTSGGTESILLACKAFRDFARETKGIRHPEMVVPVTIHSAFDKAAQYLGIRVRSIPVDQKTFAVDLKAMRRAISRNTVLLGCSVPNFPYGTMDDVAGVAALGKRYGIPVHVDACLGGFLVCFMNDQELPAFDFRVPGVSSISADTHKYGFSPKGSSLILYRERRFLHHQYTVSTDWPGGIYGSPTIAGSRPGGSIAVCWATLMHYGKKGYLEASRRILDTTKYLERELRATEGIFIFGKPITSVIAIGSKRFDIYKLSEALNKRGWSLNILQFPSAIHLCVTHVHTEPGIAQQFIKDVREDLQTILKAPCEPVQGMLAMYGTSQGIADRSMVTDITRSFLDAMLYVPKDQNDIKLKN